MAMSNSSLQRRRFQPWLLTVLTGIVAGIVMRIALPPAQSSIPRSASGANPVPAPATKAIDSSQSRDFRAAIEEIQARTAASKRVGAEDYRKLQWLATTWMKTDPIGCLNYLKEARCLSLVNEKMLSEAVAQVTGGSLEKAIAMSQTVHSGAIRDHILREACSKASALTMDEALFCLQHFPKHLVSELWGKLANSFISREGRAAVEKILELKDLPGDVSRSTVAAYAATDLDGAVELITTSRHFDPLSKDELRLTRSAALKLILGGGRVPAAEVLKSLRKLPPSPDRDIYLGSAAGDLIAKDPARFREVLDQLDNISLKSNALVEAAKRLDHASLFPLIQATTGVRERSQLLWTAAVVQGQKDPVKALEQTNQLQDPISQRAYLRGVMGTWLNKSPKNALEYCVKQFQANGDPKLSDLIVDLLQEAKKNPRGTNVYGKITDLSNLRQLDSSAKSGLRELMSQRLSPSEISQWDGYFQ